MSGIDPTRSYKSVLLKLIREKTGQEPKMDKIKNTLDRWIRRMFMEEPGQEWDDTIRLPVELLTPRKEVGPVPCGLWSFDKLKAAKATQGVRKVNDFKARSKWIAVQSVGQGQSPVDIQTTATKPFYLPPFDFLDLFRHGEVRICNDGTTMKVRLTSEAFLTDGPVFCKYLFKNLHFHWSEDSCSGTEHAIDGKRFALEAHFVFVPYSCEGYQKAVRQKAYNAVVIAVLFKEERDAPFYQTFTYCESIRAVDSEVLVAGNVLRDFQRALGSGSYYNYSGSLTTPPYTENVNFSVMKAVQGIRKSQLNAIRSLHGSDGVPIQGIVRKLQSFGPTRKILSSVDSVTDLKCMEMMDCLC